MLRFGAQRHGKFPQLAERFNPRRGLDVRRPFFATFAHVEQELCGGGKSRVSALL